MAMAIPSETDVLTAARFSLSVDGHEVASFSELGGITSSIEVADVVETVGNETVLKKLPGKRTPPTLTLKRGKNSSLEMWQWHEAVWMGDPGARKSCSLVMYNTDGTPVARYHLEQAWPAKIEIGGVKSGANEVLVETVTIVCEHLQRLAPS
jgi:phage tail-like protein